MMTMEKMSDRRCRRHRSGSSGGGGGGGGGGGKPLTEADIT